MKVRDKLNWKDHWTIRKYANKTAFEYDQPFEVVRLNQENVLLNTGINELWALLTGDSNNVFSEAKAQIGVGDDDTGATASQTDLLGGNTTYKGMDTGYPSHGTDQKIRFRAVFEGGEANYDWREMVVRQEDSAICLNRIQSDQGTKASGQIWAVNVDITIE